MSMGQLVFYCGAGLLALTIVLTIIFIVVKPKYKPESPATVIPDKKKKAAAESNETVLLHHETEIMEDSKTEIMR